MRGLTYNNRQLNKKVKRSQTVRLQKLILSELINFYPPEVNRKPEVFWWCQGK